MRDRQDRERLRLPDGLPLLDGAWRWPFLVFWALSLVAALAASVAVMPDAVRAIAAPASPVRDVGLILREIHSSTELGPPVGAEVARLGLRAGMRLVSIDGRPPARSPTALDRQFAGPAGGAVAVVVATPAGNARTLTLTRDPDRHQRALGAIGLSPLSYKLATFGLPLVYYCLLLGCAVLLMVRRSRDRLVPWTSLMLLWLLIGAGEPGDWIAGHFTDETLAYSVFNGFAFAQLVVVLAVFPEGRFTPRWSLGAAAFGVVVNMIAAPLPNWQSNSMLEIAQCAAVAAIVARYRRMPPGVERQQIRWALFGFVASFLALLGLMLGQLVRVSTDSFGVYAWLTVVCSLLALAYVLLLAMPLTVSLLRYRLYGADATISRSVAYGVMTLGLIAVFAAAEKLIELTGEHYFGERLGTMAGAAGAAVAAMMVVPLHHRTTKWAERRFRSGLAKLREHLPLLVGDLRETATPRALAAAMLVRVEDGVRARHGAVLLRGAVLDSRDIDADAVGSWAAATALPAETTDDLVTDRADPLFPVRVPLQADGVGLVGWLLLGPRPDGSFYGREERAALRAIADPVARALAIADARDRRDAAVAAESTARRAREDRLERSVQAMRRFIADRYGVDPGATPA